MRNFNWETLPKHTVIGKHNIWTADKTDGEYELDTDHMEELFSHKQNQQKFKAQSLRGLPAAASGGEVVSASIRRTEVSHSAESDWGSYVILLCNAQIWSDVICPEWISLTRT